MANTPADDLPLMSTDEGIVLCHPHIPRKAKEYVCDTLDSRWIGQGPKVDLFEASFRAKFRLGPCVSVGSGTDALHLAYLLAGIQQGDEVLAPLFTCTATNIPLLYIGAKIKFVDVDPITLNVCIEDLRKKISERTKAIVCVHYGGLPCDMDEIWALAAEHSIPVIEDAAQALGATYRSRPMGCDSEFTIFSFQAVKLMTTGDGGMLTFKNSSLDAVARRLRWFGIDRALKHKGVWKNDITEIGYKYQLTDIGAALGLAALEEFEQILELRTTLYQRYVANLRDLSHVRIVDDFDARKVHAAWLFSILVERRRDCQLKLRGEGIESGQMHYRNDRYSVFSCNEEFPRMDSIDGNYLCLPLHTKMNAADVDRICDVLKAGW
jgi:perosamine synthetase